MENSFSKEQLETPWRESWSKIVEKLGVSPKEGLSESEATSRRARFGENRLRDTKKRSMWEILFEQFKSLIVLLLVVAAIISFLFGEWVEGIAITAVILINAALGFGTELKAVRSMEALQEMGSVNAKVRRGGQAKEIPAREIVPGDIVIIEGGDIVTADLRLLEASKLQADESALTGESVPVSKQIEPLEEDIPLAERSNMLFKGTAVTRGAGEGVVVATGMDTELGHISSLVEEAEEEATPLEERLEQLGRKLIWATLIIGAFVTISGIVAGKEIILMVETGIALAVASIPEGMPIVATIALARGMRRMAKRNALINRLSAVETLGATNIILTDKTGTLTENRMTVTHYTFAFGDIAVSGEGLETEGEFKRGDEVIDPTAHDQLRQALKVGVLCNNAAVEQDGAETTAVGDPLEVALLVAGTKAGLEHDELIAELPEEREVAFDPDDKMMATFHKAADGYRVAVKGALEAVLDASTHIMADEGEKKLTDEDHDWWIERNEQLAADGLRVLALATKTAESVEEQPYENLTFLGLVGLLDPPRAEVRPAITACQQAGVRVVMVTGDQANTARNVAHAVGLVSAAEANVVRGSELQDLAELSADEYEQRLKTNIFARVNPEQKLKLIAMHQDSGAIVAMTGDGVNDAPALKKADIGVAMGQRGTQVAREAADMVLTDDAFSSIVVAVEQGRAIFNNIRKFVLYLLSCNVAEVMIVSLASLINAPLPIRPLQILFLNLVTDVFPALALGVGEGDEAIMERPPRDPDEPIMTRRHWYGVGGYGALITGVVLATFALAFTWLGADNNLAVTISFLTLALAQLWHVFNMRDRGSNFFSNEVTRNPYIWGALALCVGLLILAVYLPGLSDILRLVNPGVAGWALVVGMSLVPWAVGQILKEVT